MNERKLKRATLTPILIATLALMIIPCVIAAPVAPEVWPTDSLGNPKGEFDIFDDVFVMGSGFPANTEITIYVWDPDRNSAVASSFVITDGDGSIPVTPVWSSPLYKITTAEGTIYRLRDYEYEIFVDLNGNGQHDNSDVSNSFTVVYPESHHRSAPEFVVPEPGTMILMLAMFGAFATAYLARKRVR